MIEVDSAITRRHLGASALELLPMAQGGSWYAGDVDDRDLLATLAAAYEAGIRHFDTAAGYGGGHSEELVGRFIADKRDAIFLASKSHVDELTAAAMLAEVEGSLRRLATDRIDLYYIHWPRAGRDLRPWMEGLAKARDDGKIGAIGVSNFSVAEMQQAAEVAPIAVHQLGYNLLWRHRENDVIRHCRENGIAVIAYSALSHGILTGKFGRDPGLVPGDQRHRILPFRSDLWPHVHAAVEELKAIAADTGIPLPTLAIRWILSRPGIAAVVAGARSPAQAAANVAALTPAIPHEALAAATAVSDRLAALIPDAGNLFDHYP